MARAPRIAIALVAVTGTLVAASAVPAATFTGTVGPSSTITLRKANGNDVTSVRAGQHTFVVRDRSSIHNFVLLRGTNELRKTGVTFTGRREWTLRIRTGAVYRYRCATHPKTMRGSFTVS